MRKTSETKRRNGARPGEQRVVPGAKTARGLATQAALVRAARKVFERDGFLDARVTDIAATAGTALGSFYNYFENKEEIFGAVVEELMEQGLHPPLLDYLTEEGSDVVESIANHHRGYLGAYQRNVKLMRVMEQVTNVSDSFRRQRTASAQRFMQANAAAIRLLQETGRADPELDPVSASRALSTMVSRSAYVAFVLEEEGADAIEGLAETLTRLWVNALKIPGQEQALTRLHAHPDSQ
jgi:AcrR family transcriptional regulator